MPRSGPHRFCAVILLAVVLGACHEAPTGSPPPTTTDRAADAGRAAARPGRVSPETQKQSRVDACAYGTLGLYDVRDAYLASLGGKEPGPGRVPEFGPSAGLIADRPERGPRELAAEPDDAGGSPDLEAARAQDGGASNAAVPARSERRPPRIRPLQHLSPSGEIALSKAIRTCTVASKLAEPPVPELDTELGRFESYASKLFARLTEAARYYRTGEHDKDGFAQGRRLHAEIVRDFALLTERASALRAAVERWREGSPPPPDELDADAKMAERAVRAAREVTRLLVARAVPDPALLDAAVRELGQANTALTELGTRAPRSPFARLLAAPLGELERSIAAARDARKAEATEPPRAVCALARRYAAVTEEWSRALARSLGERVTRPRERADRASLPIHSGRPPLRAVGRPPAAGSAKPLGSKRP